MEEQVLVGIIVHLWEVMLVVLVGKVL